MVSFSQLLRDYLTERGWTQKQFAKRVGVNPGTISAILLGKRKPWFGRAMKWADVLELKGAEREAFLDSFALAASPSRMATVVARLEHKAGLL